MPKPMWLKTKIGGGGEFAAVRSSLHGSGLHTVCEEALCPNLGDCWNRGTATFMVLGKVCTRHCLFCAVQSGACGQALESMEPCKIAEAVKKFGLRYVVLTSVDRDDLPDFGAGHFAQCVREIKNSAEAKVEVLIPDFNGNADCLRAIVEAKPDVIGHNIEVVERLQGIARDAKASYRQSLGVLKKIKEICSGVLTKSGIMLGLGETREEVLRVMKDLRVAGCDFLTIGQYLQPSKRNLPVQRYVPPAEFEELRQAALEMGFKGVEAGPLVRSSYRAERALGF
ncbi:MAG: lipoyl synthase [Candidatus Diapherotrites archaeon]|nr:lipoyl synthase [Candidatus Diapherotrites archaeon]